MLKLKKPKNQNNNKNRLKIDQFHLLKLNNIMNKKLNKVKHKNNRFNKEIKHIKI